MPANDSMSHRGASAVRSGRRYNPYVSLDNAGLSALKSHSSLPIINVTSSSSTSVSSPEDSTLDSSEVSSTATLVNSSFDGDKWDNTPIIPEVSFKAVDKLAKYQLRQRQAFHQKKVDYVAILIDFTCATLNEVWPIAGIPAVFRYQHGANFGYTPDTVGVPVEMFKPRNCEIDLINLRKFVSELLRRSRSTCSTLQTALCYIEGIRHKVRECQLAELQGKGMRGDQVNNEGRIEIDPDAPVSLDLEIPSDRPLKCRKAPSIPALPLPQLPSALLCPRRAFMGALVLSAKFVQDKCYSNRAWAKLCGLPAREVSRCERALGDALGWRLWVGKDNGFSLAGLESKVGRAPTMLDTSLAIMDKFEASMPVPRTTTPLARAQTWPCSGVFDAPVPVSATSTFTLSSESEYSISPTPSLTSSSSGSSCYSAVFTPNLLSPSPMFVPNDPCYVSAKKSSLDRLRISNLINNAALTLPTGMNSMSCGEIYAASNEQDAFGIRVADGVQVV